MKNNIQYFAHFIRKNYPEFNDDISDEECVYLGEEFKIYLLEIFKDNEETLEKIWDITPIRIIMESNHPLKINGYHPALILHFNNFIEYMKNKITKDL